MTIKKTALSIIAGALIMFIWNALSWMALPFHTETLNNIPEAAISPDNLASNLSKDGVYHYPGLPADDSSESMRAIEEKLQKGPRITLMVYKSGSSSMYNPGSFFLSFVFNAAVVGFLFMVVSRLSKKTAANIFNTCILLGLLVSFTTDFPMMGWYMFPLDYTMANVLDHVISFGFVGMLFGYYTFKEPKSE